MGSNWTKPTSTQVALVRIIGSLIVPQAFVGSLPWWHYDFRIVLGYGGGWRMQVLDLVTFTILAGCAWAAWRTLPRAAPSRIFRAASLLLIAATLLLCAVVVWAFIFVPYVPAHFPPWTTGTTLAATLSIIAPSTTLVAVVSFATTLLHVLSTQTRAN